MGKHKRFYILFSEIYKLLQLGQEKFVIIKAKFHFFYLDNIRYFILKSLFIRCKYKNLKFNIY